MKKHQAGRIRANSMESFSDSSALYQYDRLTGLPSMSYFFELARAAKLRLLEQSCS